jgi:hypothetical protein
LTVSVDGEAELQLVGHKNRFSEMPAYSYYSTLDIRYILAAGKTTWRNRNELGGDWSNWRGAWCGSGRGNPGLPCYTD